RADRQVGAEARGRQRAPGGLRGRGRPAGLPPGQRRRCDDPLVRQSKGRGQLRLPRRRTDRRAHRRGVESGAAVGEEVVDGGRVVDSGWWTVVEWWTVVGGRWSGDRRRLLAAMSIRQGPYLQP